MAETATARPAALVTGGGRGIGRAISLALAAAGFDICINYAGNAAAAEQTAADCAALGVKAVTRQADVSDPAARRWWKALRRTWAAWMCWSTTRASRRTS